MRIIPYPGDCRKAELLGRCGMKSLVATWEVEADELGVQIHPWLHSKFKAILSRMMKKQNTRSLEGIGDKWHQTGTYRERI